MSGDNTPKILLVDQDRPTTAWLKGLLEPEGYKVGVVQSASEALASIRAEQPALTVFELDLPDLSGLDLCRSLRRMPGVDGMWLIAFSARASRADIAAGLEAGADDYIPKRSGADADLLAKAKLMLGKERARSKPNGQSDEGRGRIVSFFSAKGGSGTTTLSVNAAYSVSGFAPKASTLLVDMVFPLGAVGHMIGTDSTETIARLTREGQGPLARKAVERHISTKSHLDFGFLLSANDLQEAEALEVGRIVPLFELLRTMFDIMVIDFGHSLSRITLPILESSDLIYVIVIPDVTGVALTKLSLDYLFSRGIPRERVVLIQNRTVPRSWLSRDEIERELGLSIAITVPYDGEQVPLATNAHVPYLKRHGDTTTAATLRELGRIAVERLYRPDGATAINRM